MMRHFLVSSVLLWVALTTAAFADTANGDRQWTRSLPTGETQYLMLHGDEGYWTVELVIETHGHLPDPAWQRHFKRESDALRFALKSAARGMFGSTETLAPRAGSDAGAPAVTEAPGVSLWQVTQSWTWDWELKYDAWVRDNVTPQFFQQHQIATDCADVAYSLRWIFARIHGLPAANRLSGSGVMFSQDSVKSDWLLLPTDPDWTRDRRFLKGLEYLLKMTYTHSLIDDSYPIEISRESLRVGTHHLELHKRSGHTMFVSNTDFSDASTQPIEVIFSSTPIVVRELYRMCYWRADQPEEGQGGFLRMRWPHLVDGQWKLTPPASHPHYSREQFQPEFMQKDHGFGDSVLTRLNPHFDYRNRVDQGLKDLVAQLEARVAIVAQGFTVCGGRPDACPEGSADYDAWSTFSRDARIGEILAQLRQIVANAPGGFGQSQNLRAIWETGLRDLRVTADGGANYSLAEAVAAWQLTSFSSDPRVPPRERWGIDAEALTSALAKKMDSHFVERAKRIAAQGAQCATREACAPGGDGWLSWNTFDIDTELRTLPVAIDELCALAPAERCQSLQAQAEKASTGAGIGRSQSLAAWREGVNWLISDPRSSIEERWGSHARGLKTIALGTERLVETTVSGILVTRQDEYQTYIDAFTGAKISSPAGLAWTHFDPVSEWAVARSSDGTAYQVVQVRDGNLIASGTSQPFRNVSWAAPGVLIVELENDQAMIRDLKRSPVFESGPLPGPKTIGSIGFMSDSPKIASWPHAADDGTTELIFYRDGKVSRVTARNLPEGVYAGNITAVTDRFVGGALYQCVPFVEGHCNSSQMYGAYALTFKDGITHVLGGAETYFQLSDDGRNGLSAHWGASPSADWVSFDEDFRETSKMRLGSMLNTSSFSKGEFFILADDVSGTTHRPRFYRFKSGTARSAPQEFKLSPDETEILGTENQFVLLKLKNGSQRIRAFESDRAIFESAPGDTLGLNPSRDGELISVTVLFGGDAKWESTFLLDTPASPWITGGSGMPRFMPRTYRLLPQLRGLTLDLGGSRSLWIDR